jgi:hypothetical protein
MHHKQLRIRCFIIAVAQRCLAWHRVSYNR